MCYGSYTRAYNPLSYSSYSSFLFAFCTHTHTHRSSFHSLTPLVPVAVCSFNLNTRISNRTKKIQLRLSRLSSRVGYVYCLAKDLLLLPFSLSFCGVSSRKEFENRDKTLPFLVQWDARTSFYVSWTGRVT